MAEATPFSPQVLELSARLKALRDEPLAPMFSEEEIRQRREKQARDEQLAVLAQLSGDKALAPVGTHLLPEALRSAQLRYTEHGEFNPITGVHRVFPESLKRLNEQRLEHDLNTATTRDAAATQQNITREAAAQQRRDLLAQQAAIMEPWRLAAAEARTRGLDLQEERDRIRAARSAEGVPLKGKPLATMTEQGAALDTLDFIKEKFTGFKGDTSLGVQYAGELQDSLSMKFPFLAPEDWQKNQRIWAELQRIQEMPARYALFGATLTGNEKKSWGEVTPSRGWNNKQIGEWIDERMKLAEKAAVKNAKGLHLGGFNADQLEHYSRGRWTAPTAAAGALSREEQATLERLRAQYGGR